MFRKIETKIFLAALFSVIVIFCLAQSTTIDDWHTYIPQHQKLLEKPVVKLASKSERNFEAPLNKNKLDKATSSMLVLLDVPFTSQAPFGEWSDPRQQDACEETSVLMAISWARGEQLTRTSAKEKILAIAEWEQKNYGSFVDTDVKDTVKRIIKGYFKYDNARAVKDIAIEDIIKELYQGHLVLVPTNGRKLGNPFYTSPGPERHMLVIRGYDPVKKEFITNDSGTRRGEKYRYKEDVVYRAILDYPTGDHLPIMQEKKTMIVVWQ
jgi:hypothetical protein